jgi:hypothetical protein
MTDTRHRTTYRLPAQAVKKRSETAVIILTSRSDSISVRCEYLKEMNDGWSNEYLLKPSAACCYSYVNIKSRDAAVQFSLVAKATRMAGSGYTFLRRILLLNTVVVAIAIDANGQATIPVAVLVPYSTSFTFSYYHVFPAIDLAAREVGDRHLANITLLSADTQCHEAIGMNEAIKLYIQHRPLYVSNI